MEEFFYRAIERVGFPAAVSVLSFWAVYKLFLLREAERMQQKERLAVATDFNTSAVNELSTTIKKNMGSEPGGTICKYNQEAAAAAAAAASAAAAVVALEAVEERHNERNVEQAKLFKEQLIELRKEK